MREQNTKPLDLKVVDHQLNVFWPVLKWRFNEQAVAAAKGALMKLFSSCVPNLVECYLGSRQERQLAASG